MNDRLSDLWMVAHERERRVGRRGFMAGKRPTEQEEALLSTSSEFSSPPSSLTSFFSEVGKIKTDLQEVQACTLRINKLEVESTRANCPDKEKKVRSSLHAALACSDHARGRVKASLDSLHDRNGELIRIQPHAADTRIRSNLYMSLAIKFQDSLGESERAQESFKQEITKKALRQVRIVYPEASHSEAIAFIDAAGADRSASVAISSRVSEGLDTVDSALRDREGLVDDLKKLERSVTELQAMYSALSQQVESKVFLLNQIEDNVYAAQDFTNNSLSEVQTARKHQTATFRRHACFLLLVVALGVLFISPLLP